MRSDESARHPREGRGKDQNPAPSPHDVFWKYAEQLNRGETVDEAEIRANHPDLADEVLRQLAAFREIGGESASDNTPPLGTLGDYTLRRQIGRGGMGVVYEAWEGSMERQVALKVLPPGVAADERAFQRFMQEAKTAGKLSHPNIVPVFFTGMTEQTPFYAMEYVEGQTLARMLGRLKEAEPETQTPFGNKDDVRYFHNLAEVFADVSDGLQHAHSKGVIHRDIKPSNLIVDGDGRLRILDFGLARLEGQESLTLSGDFVGTPAYMSPEQAKRRKIPVDHRTDIYSLGATLYELLTGQQPFRGRDHNDTLSQIIERDPRPPRQLHPRVPQDLETIVLKCLRKDVEDRYGTAEALGQDLRRFVRGDPIEAKTQSLLEKTGRRLWLGRRKVAFAGLVILLVIVTGTLTQVHRRQQLLSRLAKYENGVVRSMLRLQLAAIPESSYSTVNAGRSLTSELFDTSDVPDSLNNLHAALEELRQLQELVPDSPEAYYQHARILLALTRHEEAITELLRVHQRFPAFVPAWALLHRSQLSGPERERASEAQKLSQRYDAWFAQWTRAHEAVRSGDHATVIDACTQMIDASGALTPPYRGGSAEARLWRGQARLQMRDFRALEDFYALWANSPSVLETQLLLASAFLTLERPDEAEEICETLYAKSPEESPVSLWAAGTFLSFNEIERADGWIVRIPETALKARLEAISFLKKGNTAAAVAAARRAVKLDPTRPYNFGVLYEALDRRSLHEERAAVTEEAVRHHPENPDLKTLLAFEYFRRDRLSESVALAREVLEGFPHMTRAWEHLGLSLFRQGKVHEALTAFETAAEDPAWNQQNLGWALFCLGRLNEAAATFEHGRTISPHNPDLLTYLAVILERQGHSKEALHLHDLGTDTLKGLFNGYQRGIALDRRGDASRAIEDYLAFLINRPGAGFAFYRASDLLRLSGRLLDLETLNTCVTLLASADAAMESRYVKCLLAHLLLLRNDRDDVQRALDMALALTAEGKPRAEFHATLSDAQWVSDDRLASILNLELALSLPNATRSMARVLQDRRQRVYPLVASCASVDAALREGEKVSGPHSTPVFTSPGVEQYDHAVRLVHQGDLSAARETLEELLKGTWRLREALLRLVRTHRRLDDLDRAVTDALEGWATYPGKFRFAGELALCWNADRTLVNRSMATAANLQGDTEGRAEKLRHWLHQLDTMGWGGINCGGGEHVDIDGRVWQEDKFFEAGWLRATFELDALTGANLPRRDAWDGKSDRFKFHGAIANTEDDYLYQTDRWFHPSELRPRYAIPTPSGQYRVRLHLAETWYGTPGLRRFAVAVEAEQTDLIDVFGQAGFAAAIVLTAETNVQDGLLTIEFFSDRHYPVIAAIEIARVR